MEAVWLVSTISSLIQGIEKLRPGLTEEDVEVASSILARVVTRWFSDALLARNNNSLLAKDDLEGLLVGDEYKRVIGFVVSVLDLIRCLETKTPFDPSSGNFDKQ